MYANSYFFTSQYDKLFIYIPIKLKSKKLTLSYLTIVFINFAKLFLFDTWQTTATE
jgi:hypothetical protein